ncbi:MAG: mycofactocin biosynthesis peptidyl-dipeptidase MftE [Actinobacteria bacterium]|nr:mycofactocin biosynthesis peptidyl-dipeptidase MftE [Actinomycetota bacterium]MBU1608685.1 mycofactocin biosynthesis peptidyl-dipeptidase MftE [Actinomycetota bacterium]MBU2315863.1 mycofactocin biosynthesis peptidyl-dipeptidase MftE [Actinomycetota bacterium]MBU2384428.1 mycofactocin biosynthesis peptidyl-dipeptidase MftE [Actinomycetota bacterium]
MRLDEQPWPEVPGRQLVIVPLGSTEQHGPHLPFTVDALVAAAVAAGAAEATDAVLAPAMPYGSSGEHQGFPGTLSVGGEALAAVLVELVRSAGTWARSILFVSGHGGNAVTVRDAVIRMRGEGHDVAWLPCVPEVPQGVVPDAHAGRIETSLMLHLAPISVGPHDDVHGYTVALVDSMPALRDGRLRQISPSGVLGDPRGASAGEGAALLAGMIAEATARIQRWRVDDDGRLGAP